MPPLAPVARGCATALLALAITACAPGKLTRVVARAAVPPARALLVAPVSLLYEHDPFEAFARTRHLLQAVIADGRLEPMGFEDMTGALPGAMASRLFAESSLLVDVGELGYRPAEILVLVATVSRSVETGVVDLSTVTGKAVATRRSLKAFVRLRLELVHPESGRLLASATDESREDLLLEGREGDPSPHLTRALRALGRRMIRVAASHAARGGKRGRPLPFDVVENPYALGVPRPAELAAVGPTASVPAPTTAPAPPPVLADPAKVLLAEAAEIERLRFLEPALSPANAKVLREGGPGLMVVRRHAPLEAGDRILLANGRRVPALPALWRAWARTPRGGALALTLLRAGRETEVELERR